MTAPGGSQRPRGGQWAGRGVPPVGQVYVPRGTHDCDAARWDLAYAKLTVFALILAISAATARPMAPCYSPPTMTRRSTPPSRRWCALAHARAPARLLVLNACHSSEHAAALCRHVPAVIGMQREISDDAARVFSGALYRAIGFGCSVAEAFEQGCAAVRMRVFDEFAVLALHHGDDEDVDALVLAPRDEEDPQLAEFIASLTDTAEAAARELTASDAPQGPQLLARFRELHAQHLDSVSKRQAGRCGPAAPCCSATARRRSCSSSPGLRMGSPATAPSTRHVLLWQLAYLLDASLIACRSPRIGRPRLPAPGWFRYDAAMTRRFVMLALAALPLSCGTAPGGDDGAGPPTSELFADLCEQLFECDCDYTQFADQDACEQYYAERYSAKTADLTVDDECNAAGRSNDAFEYECRTWSEQDQFQGPGRGPTADLCYCAYAYGKVPEGGPCVESVDISECARGLMCYLGACIDPCASIPPDASCGGDPRLCADGQFCDFPVDRCVAYAQEGENCESKTCAIGLECILDGSAVVCRPYAGPDEPCDIGRTCQDGLWCDLAASMPTCQPKLGEGEPCPFEHCLDILFCKPDGDGGSVCGSVPKVGEPCNGFCEDDAWCDGPAASRVCKSLPGEGQACYQDDCSNGFTCDQDICVAEKPYVCGEY